MLRDTAIQAINNERNQQESLWPRVAGTKSDQYRYAAPHILLLEEKIARLRGLWYGSKTEELQQEFVKIGAIAVRALEEIR